MTAHTYAKGLLFWVDDSLDPEMMSQDTWTKLFPNQSDKVFRLLDLSLTVSLSYEDAVKALDEFEHSQLVGTYVFCVLDLMIPKTRGGQPAVRYGIWLAKELLRRGIDFAILSSSSGGVGMIDKEGLGTIPYYVKDQNIELGTLPDSLALRVLSEFRSNIVWASLEEPLNWLSSQSRGKYSHKLDILKYYPNFGSFREYIERCEYRDFIDTIKPIVLRSTTQHSDEFIIQSVLVYLYQHISRNRNIFDLVIGDAHDKEFSGMFLDYQGGGDSNVIPIIRVSPEKTTVEQFKQIISQNEHQNNRLILVLPNDESFDKYSTVLQHNRINVVEELPQIRPGDIFQQEELIRRSCVLVFQNWFKTIDANQSVLINKGSLTHPELLINPIFWTTLLETENVPVELSDVYEILFEIDRAIKEMPNDQSIAIHEALQFGKPLKYRHMLRIGQQTLEKADYSTRLKEWSELALVSWLKTSWQFPYGIIHDIDKQSRLTRDRSKFNNIEENIEDWQDACFDVLVGLSREYKTKTRENHETTDTGKRLAEVDLFLSTLNYESFVDSNVTDIDWSELEYRRWPHRHYPLPAAILRKLRNAGRYLWIQPDRLDLALTTPIGRTKYYDLGSLVEQYWGVLRWLENISDDLPSGWKESIDYFCQVISEHKLLQTVEEEQDRFQQACLVLLNNGSVIQHVVYRLLHGDSIDGKKGIIPYLNTVGGFGKLLEYTRNSQATRIHYLAIADQVPLSMDGHLELLDIINRLFAGKSLFHESANPKSTSSPAENDGNRAVGETKIVDSLTSSIQVLLKALWEGAETKGALDGQDRSDVIRKFLEAKENMLFDSDGWYLEPSVLNDIFPNYFEKGITPSMTGMKSDYVWLLIDAISRLEDFTYKYRYYDGYQFLAVLNDLRVSYWKNVKKPAIPIRTVEKCLELFLMSIEGILAQLGWCLSLLGEEKLSRSLTSKSVYVVPAQDFHPPKETDLSKLMRVVKGKGKWEFFTLGTPGKMYSNKLTYHNGSSVVTINEAATTVEKAIEN